MSGARVITNGRPRDVLTWHDLTEKQRGEFDYLDSDDARHGAQFARYRAWVYDLGEFMRAPADLAPWQGCHVETFFSGILWRWDEPGESVIMGRFWQ